MVWDLVNSSICVFGTNIDEDNVVINYTPFFSLTEEMWDLIEAWLWGLNFKGERSGIDLIDDSINAFGWIFYWSFVDTSFDILLKLDYYDHIVPLDLIDCFDLRVLIIDLFVGVETIFEPYRNFAKDQFFEIEL